MQAKLLNSNNGSSIKLADFLSKAVEPPPAASVKGAVRLLEEIGALEPQTERLTQLGRNLANLPLPPRLGKMLLYSILFGVLDTLLTIACCISYRYWLTSLPSYLMSEGMFTIFSCPAECADFSMRRRPFWLHGYDIGRAEKAWLWMSKRRLSMSHEHAHCVSLSHLGNMQGRSWQNGEGQNTAETLHLTPSLGCVVLTD